MMLYTTAKDIKHKKATQIYVLWSGKWQKKFQKCTA